MNVSKKVMLLDVEHAVDARVWRQPEYRAIACGISAESSEVSMNELLLDAA